MNFSLKESTLTELYRILSENMDKVNYLNSSLLNPNFNYIKIKQFLSEFEFDLKLIYDTLRQFQNSSNYQGKNEQFKREKRKHNYLFLSGGLRKHLNLNNLEECNRNDFKDKKNENKKYSLTINILSDKYFDSKGKNRKKFKKSSSCKLYRKNYSKNIIKNLKKMKPKGNTYFDRNNEIINDNDSRIMTYLTDYSNKTEYNDSSNNKFRNNINKNKVSLKHLNSLYNYYDNLLRKNNNNNYANNNSNYENSTIPTDIIDSYKNNNNVNNNYNPFYKTYNIYSPEEEQNYNDFNLNDNIYNEEKETIGKNNSYNYKNNYKGHYYDYIKDYEKNNNYMKEELIKKIISQILQDGNKYNDLKNKFGNDIGQRLLEGTIDTKEINNISDFIRKYENKEEKNLFRGSKHSYRNYKYDNKNNFLLLRNSKIDNKCHVYKNNDYRDYIYNQMPLSNEY